LDNSIEKALHLIPSPTALVGARKNEVHDLATVSWFIQESINPPQILINIAPNRFIYEIINETKEFMLTVLPKGSEHIADLCGNTSGKQTDKVKALGLKTSQASKISVPKIENTLANIECKVSDIFLSGDHVIIVGEVVAASVASEIDVQKPIVCYNGEYSYIQ
jgi:flavin reductase (DIM6/NTAB) family NADH-FMN oxidoreductase RutF